MLLCGGKLGRDKLGIPRLCTHCFFRVTSFIPYLGIEEIRSHLVQLLRWIGSRLTRNSFGSTRQWRFCDNGNLAFSSER